MPDTNPDSVYARESNLSVILGVVGLFHIIEVVVTGLRAYSMLVFKKSYLREDCTIVISTVISMN